MYIHINSVTNSMTTHLIKLCKIRKSLSSKTFYLLANALIFPDLPTALLYSLTQLNYNYYN